MLKLNRDELVCIYAKLDVRSTIALGYTTRSLHAIMLYVLKIDGRKRNNICTRLIRLNKNPQLLEKLLPFISTLNAHEYLMLACRKGSDKSIRVFLQACDPIITSQRSLMISCLNMRTISLKTLCEDSRICDLPGYGLIDSIISAQSSPPAWEKEALDILLRDERFAKPGPRNLMCYAIKYDLMDAFAILLARGVAYTAHCDDLFKEIETRRNYCALRLVLGHMSKHVMTQYRDDDNVDLGMRSMIRIHLQYSM